MIYKFEYMGFFFFFLKHRPPLRYIPLRRKQKTITGFSDMTFAQLRDETLFYDGGWGVSLTNKQFNQ